MQERTTSMTTLELRRAAPFSTLFPIKENVLKKISEDMKSNGYDCAHPVIVWAGNRCKVIDGNTRLEAALKAGMSTIPVVLKNFASEEDALQYAIRSQSHRRNLSDSELLTCLTELDKRRSVGRPKQNENKIAQSCAINGRSSEKTADLLGVSARKVEQVRSIMDNAPTHIKNAVAAGEMSVNKAYNQTMTTRRQVSEDKAIESSEQVKEKRKEAIVQSIGGLLKKRIEREAREYPEICYSLAERNILANQIRTHVDKLINLLHGESENE